MTLYCCYLICEIQIHDALQFHFTIGLSSVEGSLLETGGVRNIFVQYTYAIPQVLEATE